RVRETHLVSRCGTWHLPRPQRPCVPRHEDTALIEIAKQSCVLVALLAMPIGMASAAPIVQPGKPGEASRQITVEQAVQLASVRYTTADVRFLQAMIVHHQQAVDMAALVADRTARNEMLDVAQRILASQKDEIAFMTTWLQE